MVTLGLGWRDSMCNWIFIQLPEHIARTLHLLSCHHCDILCPRQKNATELSGMSITRATYALDPRRKLANSSISRVCSDQVDPGYLFISWKFSSWQNICIHRNHHYFFSACLYFSIKNFYLDKVEYGAYGLQDVQNLRVWSNYKFLCLHTFRSSTAVLKCYICDLLG